MPVSNEKRENKTFNVLSQITGFSAVGASVTVFSVLLLYVFTVFLGFNALLSYTLTQLISITVSYFLNGKYVFKSSFGLCSYIKYYGIYLSAFFGGLVIIWGLKELWSWSEFFLSIAPIPFTMTYNFFLTRLLFIHNKHK